MTGTKQLADALFALRSPDGLRFGALVVKVDASTLAVSLRYEGTFVWAEFDRPIRVDHANAFLDKLTDGYLHRLRFAADGTAVAYCELRGPVGYTKVVEYPIG